MNKTAKPINERTKPVHEPNGANTGKERRRVRVAALLNAAASLGAVVLLAAMSGPKIPKNQGD